MKQIFPINNEIEIWGSKHQYIIRFKQSNGEYKDIDNQYLPNLEMCFKEIFENILKRRLMENTKKTYDEVLKIIKETKKEIEKIWGDGNKKNLKPKP